MSFARRRKNLLSSLGLVLVGLVALGAAMACGSGSDETSAFGGGGADGGALSDGSSSFPGPESDAASIGAASGVVLLHAATFPAFRLCFEGYPDLPPQPDRTVMPQANVVGVEVGSVVRIGPLERAPGNVYVISQRRVSATLGDTTARSCRQLIEGAGLTVDLDYHVAGSIETPLGVGRVEVLAVTGCGNGPYLKALGATRDDCDADWNETSGNLHVRSVPLLPVDVATKSTLPVQVVHMAPRLEARRGPTQKLEITFGSFDAGPGRLQQDVATATTLFEASSAATLTLDQTLESTYGTNGFRIALRGGDAGFSVDQTLADVQDLSLSSAVPTTYFLAASSYALLLLGDPTVKAFFPDAGANPDFARRSVHLLAVPIKDATDAGAPTPVPDDAGRDQ